MRSRTEVCVRNCASSVRQPGQKLVAEVLGHEPVAAGKTSVGAHCGAPRPASTVQPGTGRPASPPSARSARRARSRRARLPRPPGATRPPARPAGGLRRRSPHRALRPPAAKGQGGSSLLVTAICEPAGTYRKARRARPDRTDWRQRGGRRARARADAHVRPGRPRRAGRASPRRIAPGPDSTSNTSAETGSTR